MNKNNLDVQAKRLSSYCSARGYIVRLWKMKITRASKTTLKFMTAKKRDLLNEIMDEYSRVTNIFIDLFWQQSYERKDLTKDITNRPDSAVADPSLLNAAGLHTPYALRLVLELVTNDNVSGLGKVPGSDQTIAALEAAREVVVGKDPFYWRNL